MESEVAITDMQSAVKVYEEMKVESLRLLALSFASIASYCILSESKQAVVVNRDNY